MDVETLATNDDNWGDITLEDVEIIEGDEPAEPEETTPGTDEADQQGQLEGEAVKDEPKPEAKEETDQFTLKYLGEDKTVTRDEIVPLAQKGMDYDRIRQKFDELSAEKTTLAEEKAKADERIAILDELAKQQGFKNADELIDETRATVLSQKDGIDIAVARQRVALDKKERELKDREAKLTAEKSAKDGEADKANEAERKRQADIMAFAKDFPDVKPNEIPVEVWQAVGKGESLSTAYAKYENAQLKAQLAAEKKNAENKRRSTGSATSEGKATAQDEFDKLWYSD